MTLQHLIYHLLRGTEKRSDVFFGLIQRDSFAEDYRLLKAGKQIPPDSRLSCLSPQYDKDLNLLWVGGRLRQIDNIDLLVAHPIVLDPSHPYTKLLIKDFDERLCHPGPEQVFVWILRGREAVKRHQHSCIECRKWKSKPVFQQMVDLPVARLQLFKPAFYSTGMDCFGPFLVKVGRRQEKRWGILFKCLTTRAVHIDLLASIDTDSFLMAFGRFIARRGKPAEVYSDQGTNFKGGKRTYWGLCPDVSWSPAKACTAMDQLQILPPSSTTFWRFMGERNMLH